MRRARVELGRQGDISLRKFGHRCPSPPLPLRIRRKLLGMEETKPQYANGTALYRNWYMSIPGMTPVLVTVHCWHRFGCTLSRHGRESSDSGTGKVPTWMILRFFHSMNWRRPRIPTVAEAHLPISDRTGAFDTAGNGESPF